MNLDRVTRGWTLTAMVVTGAVAAAGCGSSNSAPSTSTKTTPEAATVDTSTIESGIKKQFSSSGAEVMNVECPSGQKSKAGTTFDCDLTWSNSATGKVKVTEERLNHYSYSLVSGSVQIPGSSVAKTLEKDLAQQGAPNATASCPQSIAVKEGVPVTCNVSGATGQVNGTVTFTFSSAEGTIDPSSVKTG